MKNKHTLANKKKFIDKVEQQLKDNIQRQDEQFFSDTHNIIAARGFGKSQTVFNDFEKESQMPGIGGTTFQVELNQNWFGYNEDGTRHIVVSKPKSPMYQRILSWLTFGFYKPTSFSYEVKDAQNRYIIGHDPYTEDGEGSMGAAWDNKEQKYIINGKG